ncbi:MAG: CarD family transcriptional regulator, partial [Treponema sp.]|nr:CarD family transcriptional regulator [Treponema sp.]
SMKTCDCREFVRIMNTVLKRKHDRQLQGKKLSTCDERYYKQAQENLCGELAVSLGMEKSQVEEMIGRQHTLKDLAS